MTLYIVPRKFSGAKTLRRYICTVTKSPTPIVPSEIDCTVKQRPPGNAEEREQTTKKRNKERKILCDDSRSSARAQEKELYGCSYSGEEDVTLDILRKEERRERRLSKEVLFGRRRHPT